MQYKVLIKVENDCRLVSQILYNMLVFCVLWKDGRFYLGVIIDYLGEFSIVDEQKYIVVFDDGFQKSVYVRYIIGYGFQQINLFCFKYGQKVFLMVYG